MTRIFCKKHMQMSNAYPERYKNYKIKFWKANCGCKFKDIIDIKIHIRWFLKDGTELISKAKKPQWELKQK